MDWITSFLATDMRVAMPIMIGSLGLVFSERSGIVNIGAEGVMLIGALAGYVGIVFTGSLWGGQAIAFICGGLVGLVFAFIVVTVKANQTVVGAALNIFGSGITITLYRLLFDVNQPKPSIPSISSLQIPYLSGIPFIGPVLFSHNLLVYATISVLILSHYVLFHTQVGLTIRAVGENPKACDTVGIHVYRVRYGATIFSCALCGLAGSYISTTLMSSFTEGMVSGRGFIALAAVVFGRWKPLGIFFASLVFGAGEALQYKLSAMPSVAIPYQFLQMTPYILTLMALIGVVGKTSAPASCGTPYVKE